MNAIESQSAPSRRRLIAALSLGGAAVAVAACAPEPAPAPASTPAASPDAPTAAGVDLRLAMRKLWEDHITYTRNFIISALGDLGDLQAVTDRLLRNQDDIGAAVAPYYGPEAGGALSGLLRDHILIAADIVGAAKAGDNATVEERQTAWSANGAEIAALLAGANANWAEADLIAMLQRHLDLTTTEVTSRLGGDWEADIQAYDEGHEHMLMFADTLTQGVIAQFPDRFA